MHLHLDQIMRDEMLIHPHLLPVIHALGWRGPYGNATIRQICKKQNMLEPVLMALLDACICDDFELKETFPAYGLLQLCEWSRAVMTHLLNQLSWLPELPLKQLRAHQEELEQTVLPHVVGIYELYYSPAFTAGKSNLLTYSIEFFPKKSLPLEALQVVEDRLEEGGGDAFRNWETIFSFHRDLQLTAALRRVEEKLLKPVVLQMEEYVINTFRKKRSKPLRLAFLTLTETAPIPELLSKREQDVLRLVAQGLMNKEIADKLNISISTVITHRKHLTEKLGIHSLAGLTVYAYTHGFLDDFIPTNED